MCSKYSPFYGTVTILPSAHNLSHHYQHEGQIDDGTIVIDHGLPIELFLGRKKTGLDITQLAPYSSVFIEKLIVAQTACNS
jgi:hypothetical protein